MIHENELEDLAHSALQEALMGGVGLDVFTRFGSAIVNKMADPKAKVRFERDAIRLDWFEDVHREEFTVPPYFDDADGKWHVYQGEDEPVLEFVELRDAIDAAQGASNGIEPVPSVERDELLEIIRGYRHGIPQEEAAGWLDRVDAILK